MILSFIKQELSQYIAGYGSTAGVRFSAGARYLFQFIYPSLNPDIPARTNGNTLLYSETDLISVGFR
jgi:hypothetical protein